jgi:hypothetical protein
MSDPIEFWHVQLPDGSVSTMTLDELDSAFQLGNINEQTYVIKDGDSKWATLALLLGLDEPKPPAQGPSRTAAPAYVFPSTPTDFVAANSLRPVVSDVDFDLDFDTPAFRSSKKRTLVMSVAAVAAVGALVATLGSGRGLATFSSGDALANFNSVRGFGSATFSSIRGMFGASPVAAASQPLPPSQPVAEPPPPAPAPPPVAEVTPAPVPDRFDETKKRALLEADKARASQQKAKINAAPSRPSSRSDGKSVFHKGGDKYDPLNSSL